MVDEVLRAVHDRRLSPGEARKVLGAGHLPGGPHARFDLFRKARTGLPEVVLGEGKSLEHFERLVDALERAGTGVLLSRLTPSQLAHLGSLREKGRPVEVQPEARMASLHGSKLSSTLAGRTAALLSAGTADAATAEEARFVLEQLGARVLVAHDVGVAGLHRLVDALSRIRRSHPSVYLVCAGREGALATLVAGLVDRPVVGIPTAHGYGRGGRGEGALTSMLQSCAPLAVVNIDGGVPGALVSAQMLRLVPATRRRTRRRTPRTVVRR